MWRKASVGSAELLTRTVKNTHEKTCDSTCCVSEGGVVGAWIQNVMGSFSPLLVPFWFCAWPQQYGAEVKCIMGNRVHTSQI